MTTHKRGLNPGGCISVARGGARRRTGHIIEHDPKGRGVWYRSDYHGGWAFAHYADVRVDRKAERIRKRLAR
jgi:hypothetical protein